MSPPDGLAGEPVSGTREAAFVQRELRELGGAPARVNPARTMAAICSGSALRRDAQEAGMHVRRGWVKALHLNLEEASQLAILAERKCSRLDMTNATKIEADLLWSLIHGVNDDGILALSHATAAARLSGNPTIAYVSAILCRSAHWLLGDLRAFDAIGRQVSPNNQNSRILLATLVDRSVEAAIDLQQLRLPMAARLSRSVIETESSRQCMAVSLLPAVVMAQIAYEHGNLAKADAAIRKVLPKIRAIGMAETAVRAYTTLARATIRRGRSEFAAMMLREGECLGEARGWPRLTAACLAERIELFAGLGRIEEAEVVFERLKHLYRPGAHDSRASGIALHLELARCKMAALVSLPAEQVTLIRRVLTEALSRGDLLLGVKLGIRLVAAMVRDGNGAEAAPILSQLIGIGCDAGLFQTFLDGDPEVRDLLHAIQPSMPTSHLRAYVATLLENWQAATTPDRVTKGEKRSEGLLTPRECNVLQLMGAGHSNKRIAQRLGIAPETVKSHAKNIFVRLGSSTRAEAVSRAASLGMI